MPRKNVQRISVSKSHFAEPALTRTLDSKLSAAWEEWFLDNRFPALPVTVIYHRFLLLPDGTYQKLDQTQVTKALKLFLLRLSEIILGRNAVKFGATLRRQFVWEDGDDRGLHNHGRVEFPVGWSLEDIKNAVEKASLRVEWIDYVRVDEYDLTAWIEYILKLKSSGSLSDHIDVDNSTAL